VTSTRAVATAASPPQRRRTPPVVVPVLVGYALSRLWSVAVVLRSTDLQLPSVWTGKHPGYFDMALLWDAQWYRTIAEHGYPTTLPVDAAGVVQQNPWAFFPGFPMTTRLVMAVTGLPFSVAAVLLNVMLGACTVIVLLRLLTRVAGERVAVGAVVLLCTFPASPVLQIAYSESLALLLVVLALWWLVERRYLLCGVAVVALSLSRPVVAPFAVVVLVHLVVRWRAARSAADGDPFPPAQRVQVVGLGLLAAASTLLWPALVGVVTGVPDAFRLTQGAWRTSGRVEPFEQALGIVRLLWGNSGPWYLLLGALLLAALVLSPWGRPLGPELQAWSLAYPAYLLAATEPWTSTFRFLLLAFPLGAMAAIAARWRWAVAVLAIAGLLLQVRWVDQLLVFTPPADYPP
jgi:hypothetical protein